MFVMYAIPNCDTVKKARTFLEKKKIDYNFIDFKKQRPSVDDIKRWSEAFGELPINKKGLTYKKFKEEFEALKPKEKITFIIEHASMIKRPILEKNGKVLAFGFEEEVYKKIK
ncbi:MAG: ArsC family reductase [Bacteriovoracaceae bacterium]